VGIQGRLKRLEGHARSRPRVSVGSARARERMRKHLDDLVRLKRGELGPEAAVEANASTSAVRRRSASRRGEGIR
jgi:hypothetical protein